MSAKAARLFPREPDFAAEPVPSSTLYAGVWEGAVVDGGLRFCRPDEKTSIQAQRRRHAPIPPRSRSRRKNRT
jgi:hypothetical protein